MDEIDALIAKKTERLHAIDRDAELIRAEIMALQEAKAAVSAAAAVSAEYQSIHAQALKRAR